MVIASDCPRIVASTTIDPQDQPIGVEAAEGLGECDETLDYFPKGHSDGR